MSNVIDKCVCVCGTVKAHPYLSLLTSRSAGLFQLHNALLAVQQLSLL